MNAITWAPVAIEPTAPSPTRMSAHTDCSKISDDQLRKLEADQAFEAGVQWFLAVSRNA